jgi:ABC-2 type transport system permease protein
MSTLARTRADGYRVTPARVVTSEWIKFWTLRSSWVTLLAAVLALLVLGCVIGYNTGKSFGALAPEDAAPSGPLQGYYLAQLLMGVLGVLFVTGEYSTGMARSTFAAVPQRLPVLAAKSLVFGVVALVSMVASALGAFFASQAFLAHYGHGSSLSDPGVLRAVIGTGVYLALIGLLGGAFGWIVRSTPGGISGLVGLLLVVPVILEVLPTSWTGGVGKYLPSQAGASFVTSLRLPGTLAPWTGLGVLVLWVAGALVVAGVLLTRRDV